MKRLLLVLIFVLMIIPCPTQANSHIKYETFEDSTHWYDNWVDVSSFIACRDTTIYKNGSASMKLVDSSVTYGEGVQLALPNLTQFKISGWFRTAQLDQSALIYTIDSTGAVGAYVLFQSDGNIDYYDGSYHVLQPYSANTWYKIELRVSCADGKYDIYINGVLVKRGASLWVTNNSVAAFVLRGGSTSMPTFWVDELIVDEYIVANFYGDSITLGQGVSIDRDWASIVSDNLGYKKNNLSIGATELVDMIDTCYSQNAIVSMTLLGYNDMRHIGDNPIGFQRELYSIIAKLSLPDILWGQSENITYSGNWENVDLGWGNHSKYGTGTATVTVVGSTVYIDTVQSDNVSTINVNIDGVDKGTFINLIPPSYSTFKSAVSGKSYSPYLLRFPGLSNEMHTVILTVTNGYVNWISSNSVGSNEVYIGNTLRMNATGYSLGSPNWNHGSDVAVESFNEKISQVVTDLLHDGLNVKYIDANSAYNLLTDVSADNVHPNDSGHSHIADAFISE
jgi:hypothetical protein